MLKIFDKNAVSQNLPQYITVWFCALLSKLHFSVSFLTMLDGRSNNSILPQMTTAEFMYLFKLGKYLIIEKFIDSFRSY